MAMTNELPDISTDWARKELQWFQKNTQYELLLSRVTPQRYVAHIESEDFYIDADNLLYFYVLYLSLSGFNVKDIVSGASTVKQVAFMLSFTHMLGLPPIDVIHFLPRITLGTKDNSYFESLLSKYGSEKISNALLWGAASGKQEITLQEQLVARMIDISIVDAYKKNNRSELIKE